MSVMVCGGLGDVREGLKRVDGGIVYGLNEEGMRGDKGYKKCGGIVGDVMGKYEGDGDC